MTSAPAIFSQSYYERLDVLERRHWWCRSVRRVAIDLVRPLGARGGIVLDAGCGTGGFLSALASRRFAMRGVGADLSLDALRLARGHGLGALMDASVVALPVVSQGVDLIVSNDVLQHLPEGDDRRAVAEAYRILKPGGFFCLRSNLGAPVAAGPSLHRRYDRESLARLVSEQGFSILKHFLVHPLARLWSNWRRSSRGEHDEHHSHGLSLTLPPAPINSVMDLYARVEDAVVRRLPFLAPLGDAQIILAQKPRIS
ncbi:MAG TPA: class I SAM-dependent methyltransferase [Thermoanaerobaculia bacterium]